MDQLKKLLASFAPRQLVTMAIAVLVCGGALYALLHWRKEADFKTLYTGLAPEDSAAVVQKLKESSTEYRLSDSGDVISVPSGRLAELRLEMAAAGLPKTGRIGFEIFDKTNLGATEFVEHVNFRRALEGELERSVAALSEVEQARVHISFPKESVFLESREPAKASVMVKLRPGVKLSARNVMAVQHLVSSAVEGLVPDAVSVLDMQGNLMSRARPSSPDEAASDAALDYRQKVERDLLQKVNMTLDPLLGHDKYRANMSVDMDLSSSEQSEESVDPAKSVMLQSQKTEEIIAGANSNGIPGTASNLPRPTSRPGSSGMTTQRRTENITWQPSKVVKTTKMPQGGVKRMSVALLLDQTVKWEGSGKNAHRVITPPSQQVLASVKSVVTAAIGLMPERGDVITVETQPFEETLNSQQPEVVNGAPATKQNPGKLLGLPMPVLIGAGVGILLIIGAAVFFFVRKPGRAAAAAEVKQAKALPGAPDLNAVAAARAQAQVEAQSAEASLPRMPQTGANKTEVLVKQLRETTKKDASAPAQILQTWIHER